MTDRPSELEEAASLITHESLDAANNAVIINCQEYLRWADLFFRRQETVLPEELHKFGRALALTMLGHLPTRPGTCPFCIQYGRSQSCQGCGYARTHGRCDADDSTFSIFIEAFHTLGRAIYQDAGKLNCHPDEARRSLSSSIQDSRDLTVQMTGALPSASALELMERKAWYLDQMIRVLPLALMDQEVEERCRLVQKALRDYW
ncbi:MAG TPA: hypothetical protein VF300_03685 [Methanothrix sp.]